MSSGLCGSVRVPTAIPEPIDENAQHVGAVGDRPHAAVDRREVDVGGPLAAHVHVEAAAVGRPDESRRLPVESVGDHPHVRSVAVHHVELARDVGVGGEVVAAEGDEPPVGRGDGGAVGARAVGQAGDLAARDPHRVDVGLAPLVFGVLHPQRREEDLLAVGRPDRAVVVPVAVGELPRGAAVGGDDEDVRVALVDVAAPVAPVDQPVDDLGPFGPVGAVGASRAG